MQPNFQLKRPAHNPLRNDADVEERLKQSLVAAEEQHIGPGNLRAPLDLAASLYQPKLQEHLKTEESIARAAKAELEIILGSADGRKDKTAQAAVAAEGTLSWPFETWLSALQLFTGEPRAFGLIFSEVARQALQVGDFKVAEEMIQGLATLRAGAALVAEGGDYQAAGKKSISILKPLETQEGLLQAVSFGALETSRSLHAAISQQVGELEAARKGLLGNRSHEARLARDTLERVGRLTSLAARTMAEAAANEEPMPGSFHLRTLTDRLKDAVEALRDAKSLLAEVGTWVVSPQEGELGKAIAGLKGQPLTASEPKLMHGEPNRTSVTLGADELSVRIQTFYPFIQPHSVVTVSVAGKTFLVGDKATAGLVDELLKAALVQRQTSAKQGRDEIQVVLDYARAGVSNSPAVQGSFPVL